MNLVFTYLLILQAQHYLSELWWLPMPCFYLYSSKVQGSCMCCLLLSGLKGQGINHQPQAPCSPLLWWRCGQCSYHWKGTTQTQPLHLYTVCMEWQTTGEIFTLCAYQPRSLVSSYISILIFILYIHGNSAHLVKWITKNNQLVNIINNCKLQVLLTAGWPNINLPSNKTISWDIKASFEKCQEHIVKLLREHPGHLHFATDAVTSPNHHAFITWTVHLEYEGSMLSFLLDIIELLEVSFKQIWFIDKKY